MCSSSRGARRARPLGSARAPGCAGDHAASCDFTIAWHCTTVNCLYSVVQHFPLQHFSTLNENHKQNHRRELWAARRALQHVLRLLTTIGTALSRALWRAAPARRLRTSLHHSRQTLLRRGPGSGAGGRTLCGGTRSRRELAAASPVAFGLCVGFRGGLRARQDRAFHASSFAPARRAQVRASELQFELPRTL